MSCALARIRDILLAHGVSPANAGQICAAIYDALGGERHYIARSDFAERNREIMAGFRGNNHNDLATNFGLTPRQVRRIVRRK